MRATGLPVREYLDHVAALADHDLAHSIRDLRGLGGVFAWMTARGLPLSVAEIIQQDEFSLDFVIPLERRYLVFGIT